MTARKVGKCEIKPVHKLLFKLVNKCLLPRFEIRHEATYLNLAMMEVLDQNRKINLPSLMIKHMTRAVDQEKWTHVLPYSFLLTRVFENFWVSLRTHKKWTNKDMFDEDTLNEYDYVARLTSTRSKSMVTNLLEELVAANDENKKMKEEIAFLNEENRRIKEENRRLKKEMKKV